MKPKTVILTVVALSCGLAASFMTSQYLRGQKTAPPEEKVSLLVAKAKVDKYTVLTEPDKFFEVKELPKSVAPGSYFNSLAEIKDKRVNKEFGVNDHIAPEHVSDRNVGLPTPKGMVASALKVTEENVVGYHVFPGDHVDVLWYDRDEKKTRFLLGNVQVLSVGGEIVKQSDRKAAGQVQTVNLALSRKDEARMTLATKHGDVKLCLRPEGETGEIGINAEANLDSLRGSKPTETPKPEVATEDKLPFGLGLKEIEKAQASVEKKEEPKEEVKPLIPTWVLTVQEGNRQPVDHSLPDKSAAAKPEAPKPEPKPELK